MPRGFRERGIGRAKPADEPHDEARQRAGDVGGRNSRNVQVADRRALDPHGHGRQPNQRIQDVSGSCGPGEVPRHGEHGKDDSFEENSAGNGRRPLASLLAPLNEQGSEGNAETKASQGHERPQCGQALPLTERQAEQHRVARHVRREDATQAQVADRIHAAGNPREQENPAVAPPRKRRLGIFPGPSLADLAVIRDFRTSGCGGMHPRRKQYAELRFFLELICNRPDNARRASGLVKLSAVIAVQKHVAEKAEFGEPPAAVPGGQKMSRATAFEARVCIRLNFAFRRINTYLIVDCVLACHPKPWRRMAERVAPQRPLDSGG